MNVIELVISVLLIASLAANVILWIRIQQLNVDITAMASRMNTTDEELDTLATRLDEIKKLTLR
ncbi:MAG: hypothetical protein J7J06_01335 [Methanosarcinales archaeon]|nr:hypothetical protein [Methanosarcinales archaeon]HDJ37709.1 hypothetical protein [Methanosarcinales archaeon]